MEERFKSLASSGQILDSPTSFGAHATSSIPAQAIADLPTTKDPKEMARRRAKLATEAIASFDAHALDSQMPTTSYDSPTSVGATYLYDVVVRLVRKHRGIQPGVVRMVNDSSILVVSRAGGNIIRVAP